MPDPDAVQPSSLISELPPTANTGAPSKCDCEGCTTDDFPYPLPTDTSTPKSKPYVPPRADANTFHSQQAFLDSLSPIAFEQLDVEKQKCPICWKPFGEKPDVGFDNSEQPVKLRCGHAFGDKCLAHTFAIPKPTTLDLQAFSFRPRSNSLALGQQLQAFALDNAGNFADDADMFIKMLGDSRQNKVGCQRFGTYWWQIIHWLLESGWNAADINFFENAVILDKRPAASNKQTYHTNSTSKATYALSENPFVASETGTSHSSSSLSAATSSPFASLPHAQEKPSNTVPDAANITMQPSLPPSTSLSLLDASNGIDPLISTYGTTLLDHEAKRRVESERLRSPVVRLVARKLVAIHKAYQASHDGAKQSEEHEQRNYPNIIFSTVLLHTEDLQASANEISTPAHAALVEESGPKEEMSWEDVIILVTRSFCKSCCTIDKKEPAELAIPKSLWWKDDEEVPDGCPLCHKVLFKKGRKKCN